MVIGCYWWLLVVLVIIGGFWMSLVVLGYYMWLIVFLVALSAHCVFFLGFFCDIWQSSVFIEIT